MVLTVENLQKSYGKHKAVDDISFQLDKGQIFAIVGPNGAGKTTTIKCILGFRKPDSGRIDLNGSFAYLPETKELYRHLTIEKMLQITAAITKNFDRQKAKDLLEEFQIPMKEKIANLSHGMLTQVYLSIVLAQDADVYLLDEPTWGLDPLMRNKILEKIRQLSYSTKSVLYTSHILSEVEKIADTVAIMVKGKIVEMDELDNLKEKYVLCIVPSGESVDGFLYKKIDKEDIYLVRKEAAGGKTEPATFDAIFEAIVKGVK